MNARREGVEQKPEGEHKGTKAKRELKERPFQTLQALQDVHVKHPLTFSSLLKILSAP